MGAWGIKTFENDGALDWLGEFLDNPSENKILDAFKAEPIIIETGFIGKLFGKKPKEFPAELDGEQVLAAAEVLATILNKPSNSNPDELKTPPKISIRSDTPAKAIAAINTILEDSNLMECWKETDDFTAWEEDVQELRNRLLNLKQN